MVINASISLVFSRASGDGGLFKKTYEPQGMEGLLRPQSQMYQSRYFRLYDVFYGSGRSVQSLSTGEVIQTLKVLSPATESLNILLLGSHAGSSKTNQEDSGLGDLSGETLCRIAEDLSNAVHLPRGNHAGYGITLYDLFLEAIKTHLSIRKVLLQKFATRRKVITSSRACTDPLLACHPFRFILQNGIMSCLPPVSRRFITTTMCNA